MSVHSPAASERDPDMIENTLLGDYRNPADEVQKKIDQARRLVGDDSFDPLINMSKFNHHDFLTMFDDNITKTNKAHKTREQGDNPLKKTVPNYSDDEEERSFGRYSASNRAKEIYKSLERTVIAARDEHAKRVTEFKKFTKAEKEALDVVGLEMTKMNKDNTLIACYATMKTATAEQIRKELDPRFFMPAKYSKKAGQLLIQSICLKRKLPPGAKNLTYNVPAYSSFKQLARDFGYDADKAKMFYEEIKKGLNLETIKRAVDNAEMEGEEMSDDPYEEAKQNRLQKKYNRAAEEGRGIAGVEMVSVDEDMADELKEREDVYLKKTGRTINTIIKSVKGYATNGFKYHARYTYKLLGMYFTAKYKAVLPFGRTLPDLTWIYIFSMLIDPTDVLCLKESPESRSLRIGGRATFEKMTMFDETADYDMVAAFGGVLKKSDDGSAANLVTTMLGSLQKLNRKAIKFACLNDDRDDLVSVMTATFKKMHDGEEQASDHTKSTNINVSTVHEIFNSISVASGCNREVRKKILESAQLMKLTHQVQDLADKKAMISPINMSFAQEMVNITEMAKDQSKKVHAKALLMIHYKDAVKNNRGEFAYLLELLKNSTRDVKGALEYWFGNATRLQEFKVLLAEVAKEDSAGFGPITSEFKTTAGSVDYRIFNNSFLSPSILFPASQVLQKRDLREAIFGELAESMDEEEIDEKNDNSNQSTALKRKKAK